MKDLYKFAIQVAILATILQLATHKAPNEYSFIEAINSQIYFNGCIKQ